MNDHVFLFDLDSTLTKVEILPTIAESIGCASRMHELTEQNMYQSVPFAKSFLERVELLKSLPVSEVSRRIADIPLNEELVDFVRRNRERCYIVTGNLDVWIDGLVRRIGMEGNVFSSKGIVQEDRLMSVASVIDKNLTVSQFVTPFVAVGDGSNDAEMISQAEVGIGFGGVRSIAPSVLEVCSHAVYDEHRLVTFLERLAGETDPEPGSKTAVISCAGMGKRLGIGTTKCLVEVAGESMLSRHLRKLDCVTDVRVVVGYQADKVIDAALRQRRDILFVFNHEFAHNGTGASVSYASRYAEDMILTLDGDLLVHPEDMDKLLCESGEFVGVTDPGTDNPVLCTVRDGAVTEFSRDRGNFEWTGVMQERAVAVGEGDGHVYQLVEPRLPVMSLFLRTKEIDTPNDYDNAEAWVRNGFSDSKEDLSGGVSIGVLGGMGTYATIDLFRRLADAFPAEKEWERPRIIIDNYCTMPSRVRAILYGEEREKLVSMLAKSTRGLMEAGCTHVLYACNTSHVFISEVYALLPEARGLIADMIDLLGRDMASAGIRRSYLLASEGTIQTGIYQEKFASYDIEIVTADESTQLVIRGFIEIVKQNKVTPGECRRFGEWVASLGQENVILGCTELPVLWGGAPRESALGVSAVKVFDPMQSAINELVRVSGRSERPRA